MKHRPALYALLRLHAEIAGELKDNKTKVATLCTNLRHIGAVIHLIEPTFDLRKIIPKRKHPVNRWFWRGDCLQGALDVLRDAEKPLTARQIAVIVLQRRGVGDISKSLEDKTTRAVYAGLKFRRGKSVIAGDEMKPIRWSLPA